MPPKVKVTKEDIISAAVEVVRAQGEQGINARTVANLLNCSTQPIFSNFATMEELRFAVVKRADEMCQEYRQRESESGKYPPYKANGMAYIRFAKEEKELFKLLYMRDRRSEPAEPEGTPIDAKMELLIKNNMGVNDEEARMFHLEMWAYVHGIATMFATNFLNLDWELVSQMLTDAYLSMKSHRETE
ncbi:MAG: WHG domain-containing protein [Ruminococcaceae bacterium]|nr:WHG domain-containing protein [Oscillospiraceae bacterium]